MTAAVAAALMLILVLLWHDSLRERRGWRLAQHPKVAAVSLATVPILFVIVVLSPLWLALALIALPALVILILALVG